MSNFLKKAIDSPFIILLMLLDLLSNIWQKSYDVLTSKIKLSDMLSNIDWSHSYDMIIRVILTVLLWKLYKDYSKFKEKKDKEFEQLKQKIIALDSIRKDENAVINRMFEENNDRYNNTVNNTVKIFKQLGVKNIEVRGDDKDTSYYKDVLNNSLDAKHDKLQNDIDNWNDVL